MYVVDDSCGGDGVRVCRRRQLRGGWGTGKSWMSSTTVEGRMKYRKIVYVVDDAEGRMGYRKIS